MVETAPTTATRQMKAPDGRKLNRGTEFQGHMPIMQGGVWRRFWDVRCEMEGVALPVNFENDVYVHLMDETEQLQKVSGWRCPDCDRPVAAFQPWCGCGCDMDWAETGWTLGPVEIESAGDGLAWFDPDGFRAELFIPHSAYPLVPEAQALHG